MKIRVFSPLSDKLGFKDKEVKLHSKIKIKNLDELTEVNLQEYLLFINKTKAALDETEVDDGDELWIMPVVEGG